MSDAVSSLILDLENYLKETEIPDTDYIAEWNEKFRAALETAEKGPDWKSIVDRAHALGDVIQKRIGGLNYERDQMLDQMNLQTSGQRALKGYSSNTH
jgi:hypothetical protein